MSSLEIAASPPIRRDETVQVALLLAFAGGYLDAYTWIAHGVMANAQTANLVLLWVHGTAGQWEEALSLCCSDADLRGWHRDCFPAAPHGGKQGLHEQHGHGD